MIDHVVAFSLVEIASGVVAVLVGLMAWTYRDRPGGTPLTVMAGGLACWAVANGLHSLLDSPLLTELFSLATHPFAALTAIGAFYVSVEYTDAKSLQGRGVLGLVVGFFLLVVALVVTNPLHGSFVAVGVTEGEPQEWTPGGLFWLHIVGSFTMVTVALGLLIRDFFGAEGIYRKQLGAIIAGGAVAYGFTALQQLARDSLPPELSFSIVGMTIFSVVILWAIFEADFLETVPLARATLVENMDDAVVALDSTDTVVDLNPRARSVFSVGGDAIGQDARILFEGYPALQRLVESAHETETRMTSDRDGDTRHYDVTVSPLFREGTSRRTQRDDERKSDSDGTGLEGRQESESDGRASETTVGRLVVIRDVTETVRRQEQLEAQKVELEAQKRQLEAQTTALERQNEQLDQFVSIVSHDLRNPLNVAQGFLDVARESDEDEHFERVERAHDRMEAMIAELLTMARAEPERIETEQVELATFVEEAWDVAETDGATLEPDLDGVTVEADPDLLGNVLENLFRNAADHNDPPLTVTVGTLPNGRSRRRGQERDRNGEREDEQESERGQVQGFYVEDDGRGIPEDERETVFEHGYTTSHDGTGFGLSIVNDLVGAHGWEITATEGADGGARFEITTERDGK